MNYTICVLLIIGATLLCGCTGQAPTPAGSSDDGRMRMSVSQMINGSTLPEQYSCSGVGQVPAITWKNVPNGTKSLALVLDDPDAPTPPFTHWIVYNLTPESGGIPPNQLPVSERAGSGYQGLNSMGTRGYAPPCPPPGNAHRYVFTLNALDDYISLDHPDLSHLTAAMDGHIIGQAQVTALYGR